MKEKEYKTAEIAANWWTEAVFGYDYKADIGAKNLSEQVSESLLMLLHQAIKDKHIDKKENFHSALKSVVNRELNKNGVAFLYVDYFPDNNLTEAACEAGFEPEDGTFPPKTGMNITRESVEVKYGHTADYETIYEEKKENKKDDFNF